MTHRARAAVPRAGSRRRRVGQAVASVTIDHWGLVGFREQEVSAGRIAGLLLVAGGLAMVRYL
jgi:uncharacterized membrane protein YdcZ (DUF606 family)